MDRRDALKAIGQLAAATGMTITPVTAHAAGTDVVCVLVKVPGALSQHTAEQIRASFHEHVFKGTALEGIKVVVLSDGMDVELIRAKADA